MKDIFKGVIIKVVSIIVVGFYLAKHGVNAGFLRPHPHAGEDGGGEYK